MADTYERVLMYKKQQVCLFKIPPLSTSKGYYLDDWKEMFWEGGVKIVEKGSNLLIQFVNQQDLSIVAVSQLPDDPYQAIQKTVDSSRGYAIRLVTPNGQYQWVGCVFRDRNDAFDMNAILQDYIEKRDMERNPNKYKNEFKPEKDFSLKEGQKIQISLEGNSQAKKQQKSVNQPGLQAFKFDSPDFGFNTVPQKSNPVIDNSFGSFQFSSGQPSSSTSTNTSNQFSSFGDWSSFGSFPSQPSQQQPQIQSNFSWSNQSGVTSYPQQQQSQSNQQQKCTKQGESINLLDL